MTERVARKKARVKAAKGKLTIWEALRSDSLDLWHNDHKKFEAAVVTLATEALSLGLLHGTLQVAVTLALGVVGTGAVRQVENVRPNPPADNEGTF